MKSFDRNEIDGAVRERAESDLAFRALLLSDPSTAMSQLLGSPVPDAVRITVHEESPTDIHLVIPVVRNLSEEDLDLVAGGVDWGKPGLDLTQWFDDRTNDATGNCGS
jgi:hypothetical protein